MMKNAKVVFGLVAVVLMMGMIGCGSSKNIQTSEIDLMRAQLDEKETEIANLRNKVNTTSNNLEETRGQLQKTEAELERARRMADQKTETKTISNIGEELLPSGANAGECFARTYSAPTYKNIVDTLLKSEASERVEIIPAKYEWVEEKVLVKQEGKRLETVPAQYEWVEEQILIQEAHQEWKKGRGLVEKVDDATGEIMCLVDVPAKYKTVRKKVQTQPAGVREIIIPAEYDIVKVRKMTSPPQERRVTIPAEYQFVTRTVKVSEGQMEWRRVLCETNMTREMVADVQRALKNAGHDPGPIDGIIGPNTHMALLSHQKANNLATGGLTYETMASLNVTPKK